MLISKLFNEAGKVVSAARVDDRGNVSEVCPNCLKDRPCGCYSMVENGSPVSARMIDRDDILIPLEFDAIENSCFAKVNTPDHVVVNARVENTTKILNHATGRCERVCLTCNSTLVNCSCTKVSNADDELLIPLDYNPAENSEFSSGKWTHIKKDAGIDETVYEDETVEHEGPKMDWKSASCFANEPNLIDRADTLEPEDFDFTANSCFAEGR